MSITAVSSIPSTVPSLYPIAPVAPVATKDNDGDRDSKVQPSPSAGTGGKVDVRA